MLQRRPHGRFANKPQVDAFLDAAPVANPRRRIWGFMGTGKSKRTPLPPQPVITMPSPYPLIANMAERSIIPSNHLVGRYQSFRRFHCGFHCAVVSHLRFETATVRLTTGTGTVIEDFCESSNELRIAFWFQMLEQKLRMGLGVLEVRFREKNTENTDSPEHCPLAQDIWCVLQCVGYT